MALRGSSIRRVRKGAVRCVLRSNHDHRSHDVSRGKERVEPLAYCQPHWAEGAQRRVGLRARKMNLNFKEFLSGHVTKERLLKFGVMINATKHIRKAFDTNHHACYVSSSRDHVQSQEITEFATPRMFGDTKICEVKMSTVGGPDGDDEMKVLLMALPCGCLWSDSTCENLAAQLATLLKERGIFITCCHVGDQTDAMWWLHQEVPCRLEYPWKTICSKIQWLVWGCQNTTMNGNRPQDIREVQHAAHAEEDHRNRRKVSSAHAANSGDVINSLLHTRGVTVHSD